MRECLSWRAFVRVSVYLCVGVGAGVGVGVGVFCVCVRVCVRVCEFVLCVPQTSSLIEAQAAALDKANLQLQYVFQRVTELENTLSRNKDRAPGPDDASPKLENLTPKLETLTPASPPPPPTDDREKQHSQARPYRVLSSSAERVSQVPSTYTPGHQGHTGGGHARYWDGCSERRRRGRVRGPVNAGPGVSGHAHGEMAASVFGLQPSDELYVFVGFRGKPPTIMMATADTLCGQLLSRRAAMDGPNAAANLANQPNALYLTCNSKKVEPLDTVAKHCPAGGCIFWVNIRVCGGAGCETDAEVETVAALLTRLRGMSPEKLKNLGKEALKDICTRLGAKGLSKLTLDELAKTAHTRVLRAQQASRFFEPGGSTKRPPTDQPEDDAANAKRQATMSSFGPTAASSAASSSSAGSTVLPADVPKVDAMQARTRTHAHSHKHPHRCTHKRTQRHTHSHAHSHTCTPTHTHTHTHTRVRARAHTREHPKMKVVTRIHTYMHADVHTHARVHA